ncbi:hypothetical protein ASZ90_005864 [hydrocarbon metagenome]|uniref:DUF2520 domain-containing protein n=1 Tax=hydrocarbon metagenome TaxID=938273 RepID=A0A0W8FU83_9ZZZZ
MNKRNINTFAIIGTGMVGTAIGFLLKKAGYKITAISDKSPASLKRAQAYIGGESFRNPQEAVQRADCILITTPDDKISSACREIALCPAIKNKLVFHMSGAGDLTLLESAKKAGAAVASIHPLQSFSSINQAIKNIPGSYFAITSDKKAQAPARNIVVHLGGIPFFISSNQKPLYHAAACIASNYLVALINTVESIYQAIGLNEKDAKKAYLPLVYGSLRNIENSGSIPSLTGPIARGDLGTIKKHISAISKNLPQYSSLYSSLGLIAVKVAQKKGTLNNRQAKEINTILKGVKK